VDWKNERLRQLRIIYFAFLTGQIIYFLAAFLLVSNNLVVLNEDYDSAPGLIVSIPVIILVVPAKLFYTQAINGKIRESKLEEKLYSYRLNNIIKYALLGASNLLNNLLSFNRRFSLCRDVLNSYRIVFDKYSGQGKVYFGL